MEWSGSGATTGGGEEELKRLGKHDSCGGVTAVDNDGPLCTTGMLRSPPLRPTPIPLHRH